MSLPEPMTPPECDLRDFRFMPLHIGQLLQSETWLLGSGDECKAALTLWAVSWHQLPAGSLPDDNRVLEILSRAGSRWRRVKDVALRNWVKCSDGRLYHRVIADLALDAWELKLRQREKGKRGADARWNAADPERANRLERARKPVVDASGTAVFVPRAMPGGVTQAIPEAMPQAMPQAMQEQWPENAKGQGQGQGEGISLKTSSFLSPPGEREAASRSQASEPAAPDPPPQSAEERAALAANMRALRDDLTRKPDLPPPLPGTVQHLVRTAVPGRVGKPNGDHRGAPSSMLSKAQEPVRSPEEQLEALRQMAAEEAARKGGAGTPPPAAIPHPAAADPPANDVGAAVRRALAARNPDQKDAAD